MKKIIFLLFCFLLTGMLQAQNKINSYEYWFDNDFGAKVYTTIAPVASYNLNGNIPTGSLVAGLHTFNVRFRDDSARYSQVLSHFFYKNPQNGGAAQNKIDQYEYWFDNNIAAIINTPVNAVEDLAINTNFPTSGLPSGLHTINLRFRDVSGKWSQVLSHFFYKNPQTGGGAQNDLVQYEYWFDNDYLSKTVSPIAPQAADYSLLTTFGTGTLPVGLHVFNIRFKDATGKWSQVVSSFFNKTQGSQSNIKLLTAYQYWYDHDFGNQVLQTISPTADYQLLNNLPANSLTEGLHAVNIRFKDTNQLWSQVVSHFFYKTKINPAITNYITAYRYWADDNFAAAIHVQLPAPVADLQLNANLNMLQVPKGARYFNIQFKDTLNRWSVVQTDSFFRTPVPLAAFSADTTSFCDSGTVAFNNLSFDTDIYQWNFGDGNTSSDSTPVHTYTTPGTYTVSLIATDTLMNLQDDTVQAAFITVNVLPTVTASASDDTLCAGQSTILSAGGNATTYNWSGGVVNNQSFVPGSSQMYVLTGSNGICSNNDSVYITVHALPTVSVASVLPNDSICSGNSVTASGAGATLYTWNGPQAISNGIAFNATQNGNYTVTGTDANGCSNTSSFHLTVFALPTVSIASMLPNDSVCSGTSVTMSGAGAVTYNWSGPQTINNGLPFTALTGGNYTVTGTDVNGCSHTASTLLTVHALPNVSVASVQPNDSVCSGTLLTLSGAGATTYSWSGPQSITNGVGFTALSSGTYTVTGSNAYLCTHTATQTITVHALPVVNVASVLPNDTVCNGTQVAASGGGAQTYVWNGPQSILNGAPFAATTSGNYTVTGTDANACSHTATFHMTVNALPNVAIGSILPNDSICSGTLVTMSGAGATNYVWSGPQSVSNAVAFTALNGGIYTLSGTDANGCSNSTSALLTVHNLPSVSIGTLVPNDTVCYGTQVMIAATGSGTSYSWAGPQNISNATPFVATNSGTYTVTASSVFACTATLTQHMQVNPLPVVNVSTVNPNDTLCSGTQLTLAGSGASTYSWTGPQSITNNTPFTANTSGNYTVTGTDGNLCSNTSSIHITVNPIPVFSLGADTSICQGSVLTLNQPYNNATVLWSNNSTADTLNVNTLGTYSCHVTLSGCSYNDTIQVGIDSLPVANFGMMVSNNEIDLSDSSHFAATYTWYFGDGDSSTLINPTHIYSSNGTYTVTLIVRNDCGADTLKMPVRIITGVTQPTASQDLLIYPNPGNGQVFIDLKDLPREQVNILLLDLKGALLMKQDYAHAERILRLDASMLSAGTYLLRVQSGARVFVQRLSVVK